jgi:RNA polymerase sigma-70 factor (ECF subfamily)
MSDSVEHKFAGLVQPHFTALYRVAVRLTRRRADAEDLVQEVCLRACSKLDELGAVANRRAWLVRTLYHHFVDTERRRRRLRFVTLAAEDDATAGVPSDDAGPDRLADARLMHERLAGVWHRLDAEQRALLSLHAEGHDLEELGQIFSINRNAVSARLHRARQRLAKLLAAGTSAPALTLVETQR